MLIGWLSTEKGEITEIKDLKDTNILGRRILLTTNALSGVNLNYTPKRLDENENYSEYKWMIIEYADEYVPFEKIEELNNKLRLASPSYFQLNSRTR